MKLVIGNKNYSSWSLRAWLLMRHFEIDFEEILIPLFAKKSVARQRGYSPAGKVPVLIDNDLSIWDSLAIAEYLAERYPDKKMWPADVGLRAHARSIVAEMHAGFTAVRTQMPMNLRVRHPAKARPPDVHTDIVRILGLWEDCLQRYGGPFLFGDFGIADAFYAPVATRFQTYAVDLTPITAGYSSALLALPEMIEWTLAGVAEKGRIASCEIFD